MKYPPRLAMVVATVAETITETAITGRLASKRGPKGGKVGIPTGGSADEREPIVRT